MTYAAAGEDAIEYRGWVLESTPGVGLVVSRGHEVGVMPSISHAVRQIDRVIELESAESGFTGKGVKMKEIVLMLAGAEIIAGLIETVAVAAGDKDPEIAKGMKTAARSIRVNVRSAIDEARTYWKPAAEPGKQSPSLDQFQSPGEPDDDQHEEHGD